MHRGWRLAAWRSAIGEDGDPALLRVRSLCSSPWEGQLGRGMLAVGTVLVVSVLVHGARAVSRRDVTAVGKGDINQPLVTVYH